MPDRVIDAPVADDLKRQVGEHGYPNCDCDLYDEGDPECELTTPYETHHAYLARLRGLIARLEAEKQTAEMEAWNAAIKAAAGVAYSCLRCSGETRQMLLDLVKPTAAREELTNPKSCMVRAKDDEMTFVLLGRDVTAPDTIRHWAALRLAEGKNRITDPQIIEALACADTMEADRRAAQPVGTAKPESRDK